MWKQLSHLRYKNANYYGITEVKYALPHCISYDIISIVSENYVTINVI